MHLLTVSKQQFKWVSDRRKEKQNTRSLAMTDYIPPPSMSWLGKGESRVHDQ